MSGCLFCRIASRELPADIRHEDDRCVAVADVAPQAPVHILVLPKAHVASAADIDASRESLAGHLLAVAAAQARSHGLDSSGYRLVLNHGADAGQSVGHLHVHLLGGRPLGALG